MSQAQKQSTALTPFQKAYTGIMGLLEKNRDAIAQAAARHLDVARLTKLALGELRKTPDLALCEPATVVASVMQAAQLGLEIGGPLGRCYLVPFNNRKTGKKECQLIIGYKGMIELALRSGMVETVEGYPVFEGDEFEYSLGLNRRLEHKPCGEDDPRKLTHVYAIVRFKGGGVLFTVLTKKAIDAVRARAAGGKNAIWDLYYPEMGVKTAIRRIFKFSPASTEMARAVAMDEHADAGISPIDIIEGTIIGAEPEAVDAPRGALDKLVEKEKAKPAPVAAKKPGNITIEGADGKQHPIEGELVDVDSGPCGWSDEDTGEACTHEGYKYEGLGYRCGAHKPQEREPGMEG